MNLATLTELAVGQVLGPSQAERGVDVSTVYVRAQINVAMHKVERAALWKFSEASASLTVPAGSHAPSSQPTDLAVPLAARCANRGIELTFHDDRQRFHRDELPQGRMGRIAEYGIWSGQLRFFPAPPAPETVELRYYRSWPDLVADSDVPPFPATWHDMLADYASARLALRIHPVHGRYVPESAARPFQEAWEGNLAAMLQSDLVLPSFDAVGNHSLLESMHSGEGALW